MGFVDLFRPKWKHSDAEVRASAVRELGPEEAEILAAVAKTDPDAAVRRIAIKKLTDPAVLGEIASGDADQDLRQMAGQKVLELRLSAATSCKDEAEVEYLLGPISDPLALAEVVKGAQLEAMRRAALARIADQRGLAEVARNAGEPSLRLEAVRGLSDLGALRGIALAEENKEVALAAVERVEDRETLDTIAKRSRVKAVRVRAQKKLEALRETAGPAVAAGQQKARLLQVLRSVESLSRSTDWEATTQKIEEAQASWQDLAENAEPELQQRFEAACQTFFGRLAKHRSRAQEQVQLARAMREQLAARTAICEQLEALGADSAGRLEELQAAWSAQPPAPEAQRASLEARFERGVKRVRQLLEAGRSQQELRARAEALCGEAEHLIELPRAGEAQRRLTGLEPQWRELGGGVDEALVERWRKAGEAIEQRVAEASAERDRRRQENLARLEAQCARLESLASTDNLRAAERQLKEAQALFRKPGQLPSREQEQALRARFQAAREQLTSRIGELREAEDWKRWSNVPKQEELCQRVEGLLKVQDLKEVAQQLKAAQAEWKRLGPAPRDKAEALWTRFKEACDKAYARCQEHFSQLEGERQQNLQSKVGLCEQVEALADSSDYEATAERIKELQAEWKKIGPVPREQSDAVWKRFRKACDKFFDRRQQHLDSTNEERLESLRKKDSLCEQVEALAESSDWEATANRIKELQAEWKKVGPVPRAKSDAVWKRFRKACDQFFDRRQAQLDEGRLVNLQQKEELCATVEGLATAPAEDPAQLVQRLQELQAEWRALGPVPRDSSEAIWQRFSMACSRVVEAYPDAFRGTDLDPQANYKKKEKLCEQLEALLPPEAPSPPPPASESESVEEMADRLRQALAANTFADAAVSAMDWKTASEEVKRVQAEWRQLGPVPEDKAEALWARFRRACDRVLETYRPPRSASRGAAKRGAAAGRGPGGPRRQGPRDSGAPREAAHRRSPPPRKRAAGATPDSEDDRPEAVAQREENLQRKEALCLQAEELAGDAEPAAHRVEIRELQRQWKSVGLVPQDKAKTLWNRFRRACNRVLQAAAAARSSQGEAPAGGPDPAAAGEAPAEKAAGGSGEVAAGEAGPGDPPSVAEGEGPAGGESEGDRGSSPVGVREP